jgi:excisionase family DNA binding protein
MNLDSIESPYFNVEELAQVYKVSTESIRRWAQSGKVKGEKRGRRWFFPKKDHTPQ